MILLFSCLQPVPAMIKAITGSEISKILLMARID
jgi:hypothetical protein